LKWLAGQGSVKLEIALRNASQTKRVEDRLHPRAGRQDTAGMGAARWIIL